MREYRYELERGSTKYECPQCGQKKLKRYIDNKTGELCGEEFGRCDREQSCGYHARPETTGEPFKLFKPIQQKTTLPVSYIAGDLVLKSMKHHEKNNLCRFLCSVFGAEKVLPVVSMYLVGTSNHWNNATVFFQIDQSDRIRAGKIIPYPSDSHHRIKDRVQWVHTVLKLPDFNLKQCLFGEHLLRGNTKPVAIVESEKTALICTIANTDFLWLATGGIGNLKPEICEPLKGRNVTLFPDLGAFDKWKEKAGVISEATGIEFGISTKLEEIATEEERAAGLDIGDFILKEVKA